MLRLFLGLCVMTSGCAISNDDVPVLPTDVETTFFDVDGATQLGIRIKELDSVNEDSKTFEISFDDHNITNLQECDNENALTILETSEKKIVFGITDILANRTSRNDQDYFVNVGEGYNARLSFRLLTKCDEWDRGNYVIVLQ